MIGSQVSYAFPPVALKHGERRDNPLFPHRLQILLEPDRRHGRQLLQPRQERQKKENQLASFAPPGLNNFCLLHFSHGLRRGPKSAALLGAALRSQKWAGPDLLVRSEKVQPTNPGITDTVIPLNSILLESQRHRRDI